MAVRVMERVFKQSKAKGSKRLVLLCYANHANSDDGSGAWPSDATVAKETGLSSRQVRRVKKDLTRDGELVLDEKRSGRTDKYIVATGLLQKKAATPSSNDPMPQRDASEGPWVTAVTTVPSGRTLVTGTGDMLVWTADTAASPEPSLEPSLNHEVSRQRAAAGSTRWGAAEIWGYPGVLTNPQVLSMPHDEHGVWLTLLALAAENCGVIDLDAEGIAFVAGPHRGREGDLAPVQRAIERFVAYGWLAPEARGHHLVDFTDRLDEVHGGYAIAAALGRPRNARRSRVPVVLDATAPNNIVTPTTEVSEVHGPAMDTLDVPLEDDPVPWGE